MCRQVDFETSATSSVALVLPTGASREEFISPSRIYLYVKEHAVSEDASNVGVLNSHLYAVIGVDRANCWSTAVFPESRGRSSTHRLGFKYIEGNPKLYWEDDGQRIVQYRTKQLPDGTLGAVFIRLMAVALSPGTWSENVAYTSPELVPFYKVLPTIKTGLHERLWSMIWYNK